MPLPFEVYFACEVENMREVEKSLHDAFLDHRINPKKEFFRLNPERVISILKLLQKKDVTSVTMSLKVLEKRMRSRLQKKEDLVLVFLLHKFLQVRRLSTIMIILLQQQ